MTRFTAILAVFLLASCTVETAEFDSPIAEDLAFVDPTASALGLPAACGCFTNTSLHNCGVSAMAHYCPTSAPDICSSVIGKAGVMCCPFGFPEEECGYHACKTTAGGWIPSGLRARVQPEEECVRNVCTATHSIMTIEEPGMACEGGGYCAPSIGSCSFGKLYHAPSETVPECLLLTEGGAVDTVCCATPPCVNSLGACDLPPGTPCPGGGVCWSGWCF